MMMMFDIDDFKKQLNTGVCIVDKSQLLKWLEMMNNIEQIKKENEKLKKENEKMQKQCQDIERKMKCVQAEISAVKSIASREFSNNAKIRRKLKKIK